MGCIVSQSVWWGLAMGFWGGLVSLRGVDGNDNPCPSFIVCGWDDNEQDLR